MSCSKQLVAPAFSAAMAWRIRQWREEMQARQRRGVRPDGDIADEDKAYPETLGRWAKEACEAIQSDLFWCHVVVRHTCDSLLPT